MRSQEMVKQLNRMARESWRVGDEFAQNAEKRMPNAEGHVFNIAVTLNGQPIDNPVTVRAWNLNEALHKAASLPFEVWWNDDEEDES